MGTMLAVKGNKTTTGGEVLDGDEDFFDENGALAKNAGLASCGRCRYNGPMLGDCALRVLRRVGRSSRVSGSRFVASNVHID